VPTLLTTARDIFARDFHTRPIKWSAFNVARLLKATGERPERVAEMRAILGHLGMGHYPWPCTMGVWDHGELWARHGHPWAIVGHPYGVNAERRRLLATLPRFPGLRVRLDDRPSYYGHGTNHVRVELAERRRPYRLFPATKKTRAAALQARRAFAEELGVVAIAK